MDGENSEKSSSSGFLADIRGACLIVMCLPDSNSFSTHFHTEYNKLYKCLVYINFTSKCVYKNDIIGVSH